MTKWNNCKEINKKKTLLDVMEHTHNPSSRGFEAAGLAWVQGQVRLYAEIISKTQTK